MKTYLRSELRRLTTVSSVVLGLLSFQAQVYGVWQPPVIVSDPAAFTDIQSGSVLKVTPQGNAISIWPQQGAFIGLEFDTIVTSFFTRGVGWNTPQIISDNVNFIFNINADIAVNSTGYAVATWDAEDNNNPNTPTVVLATLRSSSGVWGPNQVISDVDPIGNIFYRFPNVSMNEAGTALAAWRINDTNLGTEATQVSFLPFGGSWTTPFTFVTAEQAGPLSGNSPYPYINPSGNAVVTWYGHYSGNNFTFAATFNASTSTWSAPIILDTVSTFDDMSTNPRCAMAPNGTAVAIWQALDEARVSYFNGTTWEPFVTLGGLFGAFNATVVVDPQGNFTAVWAGDNGTTAATLPVNGTWSPAETIGPLAINTFSPGGREEPVGVNQQGDVIAIWRGDNINQLQAAFKPFGQPWQLPETVFEGDFAVNNENIGLVDCGFAIALWQSELTPGGQFQVKSAINGNFTGPPTNVRGSRCCDSFAMQKRCLNILKWDSDPCLESYNIYRDGVLIANVSNDPPNKFIDPICKKEKHSYVVTGVSIYGFETTPIPVVFE